MVKKKVMIFAGSYLPGVKGGGPIQSIKNLTDSLSSEFEFYIVTLDRDLGDVRPYANVKINEWNLINNKKIYYISKSSIGFKTIKNLINSIDPEVIYLNSFFSYKFSIIPIILNKLNMIKPQKMVIAPRGEFSQGALNLKKYKKRVYINFVKVLKSYRKNNLYWHVTSKFEKEDFIKISNDEKKIFVCQNFSANYEGKIYDKDISKKEKELNLVSIARIHPMKNLNYAINLLHNFQDGNITFDIYGPIEDEDYWSDCQKNIEKLPPNIKVNYKGLLEHDLVLKTFKKYHFFLFPTHGENFGHVISESLISGTPVITSDRTPWKKLSDKNIGWDINLNNKEKFTEIIQNAIDMEQREYRQMSEAAFNYGKKMAQQIEKIEKMKTILS